MMLHGIEIKNQSKIVNQHTEQISQQNKSKHCKKRTKTDKNKNEIASHPPPIPTILFCSAHRTVLLTIVLYNSFIKQIFTLLVPYPCTFCLNAQAFFAIWFAQAFFNDIQI
eukprot:62219_1